MKKFLLSLITIVFLNTISFAQSVNCTAGNQIIYGLGNAPGGSNGRTVYSLTKSGSSITYNGVFTTNNVPAGLSLAIADLGDGAKFYTHTNSGEIIKYTGTTWQTVYTTTDTFFNSAGNGNFLYFHSTRLNASTHNKIARFDGTNLTTLWNDQTVYSPVADIAVDDNGNVYFFTGATPYDVNTLNIMSPTGVMLKQIPLSFDGFTGYGVCFLDDKLNVFFTGSNSTYPNQMLPIVISGNTATLGAGVAIPQPVIGTSTNGPILLSMVDIASCSSANIVLSNTDLETPVNLNVFVRNNQLNIISELKGDATVFNALGQKTGYLMISNYNVNQMDISGYAPGVYCVNLNFGGRTITKKILKQ